MQFPVCEIGQFLSIQAQDFIEDLLTHCEHLTWKEFLSIQAQDFIEEM